MINFFAICKNDFFFKALSRLLQHKGVVLVDTCNQPDLAILQYLSCNPVPDIVLIDVNWPTCNISIIDLMRQFSDLSSMPPKIILVTNFCEEKNIEKLKRHGAYGYFYRASVHPDSIFKCIETVHNGGVCFQYCQS